MGSVTGIMRWVNEGEGKTCTIHVLTDQEYIAALETKLNEEVAEYQEDKNLEEMADVLEVLQAICVARGYSLDQLEAELGGILVSMYEHACYDVQERRNKSI